MLEILQAALNDSDAWSKDHPRKVAELIAGETGLPVEVLLEAEARRSFGVEPITPGIVEEQQALADLFFDIGMIPERLDIQSATLLA